MTDAIVFSCRESSGCSKEGFLKTGGSGLERQGDPDGGEHCDGFKHQI